MHMTEVPERHYLHVSLPGVETRSFELGLIPFTIGRHAKETTGGLSLPFASVSRHHAEIRWDPSPGAYRVRDTNSASSTLVNGHPIIGAHLIHSGDVITVGGIDILMSNEAHAMHAFAGETRSEGPVRMPRSCSLDAMVAYELGTRRSLSLLALHLESRIEVSDTWGHSAGNEFTRITYNILTGMLPRHARVAIRTYSEFVVMFRETSRDTLLAHAQSMLSAMSNHTLDASNQDIHEELRALWSTQIRRMGCVWVEDTTDWNTQRVREELELALERARAMDGLTP